MTHLHEHIFGTSLGFNNLTVDRDEMRQLGNILLMCIDIRLQLRVKLQLCHHENEQELRIRNGRWKRKENTGKSCVCLSVLFVRSSPWYSSRS